MELLFATGNINKVNEIQSLLGESFILKGLKDVGFEGDIPEDHQTLEENALQKAHYLATDLNCICFADDTGLEIDALDGKPGVYSARYAGPLCIAEDNMAKVLKEMADETNRKARFRTVIALVLNGEEFLFEGIIEGSILKEKRGLYGFGYDPIFQPEGHDVSFAEMWIEQKNEISHRALAVKKLINFLRSL